MATTRRRPPSSAVVALAVVTFAVTACSGSSTAGRAASPPQSSPAATSPTGPTGFPATPPSSSPTITQAELDAAMLDAADVGHGFVLGTFQPNTQGGPCEPTGTPSVDQRVPPEFSAGRTFDSRTVQAEITQNAAIYSTTAMAAHAFALAVRGESCRHGLLAGTTQVTISPGQDVTSQVNGNGVGKSTAWQLTSGSIRAVIVATLSGRVADACIFVAGAKVNTAKLPNPLALAKAAFDKLLAH